MGLQQFYNISPAAWFSVISFLTQLGSLTRYPTTNAPCPWVHCRWCSHLLPWGVETSSWNIKHTYTKTMTSHAKWHLHSALILQRYHQVLCDKSSNPPSPTHIPSNLSLINLICKCIGIKINFIQGKQRVKALFLVNPWLTWLPNGNIIFRGNMKLVY